MKEDDLKRISVGWVFLLAAFWWVLAFPRLDGWWAAALAVVAGAGLHTALGGRQPHRIRIDRLLAFLPWFIQQSVGGGIDVARRAFSPSLPLEPGFIRHTVRLSEGPARVFFVNCISLLPGTFSAELDGAELTVHHLAEPESAPIRVSELEYQVARLFGLRSPPAATSNGAERVTDASEGSDLDTRPGAH